MRKIATSLCAALLFLASVAGLRAATLAGVTLADTVKAGDTTLVLNGLGLRKKFVVKVYIAGLYLPQKSSDASAILKADTPMRMVMHFVHSASQKQMADAFDESFDSNSPEARKTMKADVDRFLAAIEPVKEGDEMSFTYLPGAGTTFAVNGKDRLTIAGSGFARLLFAVWLGPKPPNADLKSGILGQS
jgi:hypothetical protein